MQFLDGTERTMLQNISIRVYEDGLYSPEPLQFRVYLVVRSAPATLRLLDSRVCLGLLDSKASR